MLSITGMTLDQFADLMAGLGYKGEKSERAKVKAETAKAPEISEEAAAAIAAGQPIPEEVSILAPPPEPEAEAAVPEMEAFYTFTWAPKPRPRPERAPRPERKEGDAPRAPRGDRPKGDRPQGDRPQGDRPRGDRPKGDRPKGDYKGGKPQRDERQKSFEARPPRAEKPIDPDNPFAALLALKGKV